MFFCLLLFEGTFTVHNFSKIKLHQEVTKQKESMFFLLFLMVVEGPGSVPKTNGSGSGSRRPNYIWIWIQIRIHNTAGVLLIQGKSNTYFFKIRN